MYIRKNSLARCARSLVTMELSGHSDEPLSQNSKIEEADLNNLDEAAQPKHTERNTGYAFGKFAAWLKKRKITIDISEVSPEEFAPTLRRYALRGA